MVLFRVDLTKQGTPVGQQAAQEFGVRGIPSVHVFGKDGQPIAKDLHGYSQIESAVLQGLR